MFRYYTFIMQLVAFETVCGLRFAVSGIRYSDSCTTKSEYRTPHTAHPFIMFDDKVRIQNSLQHLEYSSFQKNTPDSTLHLH